MYLIGKKSVSTNSTYLPRRDSFLKPVVTEVHEYLSQRLSDKER